MHKSFPQTVSADTEVLLVCIFYLLFFFFPPLHKLQILPSKGIY